MPNAKKLIGIDPGANGAIVMSDETGEWSHDLTTIADLVDLLKPHEGEAWEVYLEDLVKFAGRNMPSSSMATYASSWGAIQGVIQALRFRLHLVRPQAWQKELSLGTSKGGSKTEWKNKLKAEAQRLYPNLRITLKNADAVLILEYAKRVSK